ncbi:glycosyltransferase [Aliiglaciecola lipolytica]|uniref:Glycosyltransferase n=1 Tax=Aliiglaciecola lipolytica E3 TaxID=1127673 RepID=K6YPX2_9ALTE|nr:glycosyltransferase [Aliiglaciecola lipolytica]GAC13350.1 glycosyltransferase [Aliiglaciecola lipolytica E3]
MNIFESVVGMGVYIEDQLKWVKQSVESILSQSYQNYLLVLVLDGEVRADVFEFISDLCKTQNNILLVRSSHNVGLSACMNYVIDWTLTHLPSAKYFFRMDADDISLPDRFKKQIKFLKKHKKTQVLGTSLIEINEFSKKVGKRKLPKKHEDIFRILPKRCAINHPTVVVRTDVFKAGHRYQEDLQNTQDYFLWIELCAAGYKFANLPEPLLEFRRVNNFYKRRGLSKSINEFKARFYAMKVLNRYSIGNIVYAFAVLFLRLMPSKIVKLAYKIDRYLLNKRVRHE